MDFTDSLLEAFGQVVSRSKIAAKAPTLDGIAPAREEFAQGDSGIVIGHKTRKNHHRMPIAPGCTGQGREGRKQREPLPEGPLRLKEQPWQTGRAIASCVSCQAL